MNALQPGQRLPVNASAPFEVRFSGRDAGRIAVAAVSSRGEMTGFDQISNGVWHLPSLEQLGENAEIIAYITDDTMGGFVTGAYPLTAKISGNQYELPAPPQQLAAVIIAEVYTKTGERRLKISNEGYTFGIDAFIRARNYNPDYIPHRRQPAPQWRPDYDPAPDHSPRPHTGEALGSGSGVLVGPDLIVTNAHVVEDGAGFQLGRSRERCQLIAVDPIHDLALLTARVSGTPLPLRIGAPLWLGEGVMASGYPLMDVLGADLKVTTGNVSGLTGSHGDTSRFQFTAPIGSGSSGGAIVDEAGNLVGITSASLAHQNFRERGSLSENVNFAIRAALVFEMIAAAGKSLPNITAYQSNDRREVVNRLRDAVVSITVLG